MNVAPFRFSFRIRLATSPSEMRDGTIRSVLGDPDGGAGELEVLENGPQRFASRMRLGEIAQLRVIEWEGADRAHGGVEHSESGRPRLSARYRLRLVPDEQPLRVDVAYALATPFRGLALSFRLSSRRSLARRLSAAWLRTEDPTVWSRIELPPRSQPDLFGPPT